MTEIERVALVKCLNADELEAWLILDTLGYIKNAQKLAESQFDVFLTAIEGYKKTKGIEQLGLKAILETLRSEFNLYQTSDFYRAQVEVAKEDGKVAI